MEVCEEIISYPFVKYTVNVSHVTSRNSTAFEWLFLETLIKSSGTEFQNENVEDFFKNYFQIDNPEKLIKPILKKLYDLQAVACPKLTDDISLSGIALKDVEVLPLGREMQQKGLLPGEHSRDTLDIVYDVSKKKLIADRSNFSAEADGNYVSVEGSAFPEKLVRDYIESQRPKKENPGQSDKKLSEETLSLTSEGNDGIKKSKKKEKKNKQKKLDWLKDNTEIDSVVSSSNEMCFDNIKRKVHLNDGLIWKIESNKIVELEEASLENFENNPPEALENCPMTSITKPDEQIQQIILFSNLKNQIQTYLNSDKIAVIDSSLFDESKKNNNKTVQSVILFGASEFSVKAENKRLVVYIPGKLKQSQYVYMNDRFCIKAEKFNVKAGDISKDLTFAYLPKNEKKDIKTFILSVVERYYTKNSSVLLLLNEENGLKNEFQTYFEKLISNCTVKEKANRINELNQQSTKLTDKKCISDETVFSLIINKGEIKKSVTDFASARKVIEDYSSISIVKNQVLRDFLKIVLESLNPTDSVEEIWQLIDFIKQKSPDSVGFLDKQGIIGKLYSESAKNDVFKKAFSEKLGATHCDFEDRALKFASLFKKINSGIDERRLKEDLNTWKNNFGNLRKYYGTIGIAEEYNQKIESKISAIKNINGGKR